MKALAIRCEDWRSDDHDLTISGSLWIPTIQLRLAKPCLKANKIRTSVTAVMHWFALYTTSRHEKRISQHLEQREIDHYLPLYRADRKWRDGSKVALDLPLFPGYIFVRIERSQRSRVLSVPGALALVTGTGGEPAAVGDSVLESLRNGLIEQKIEPHPLLRVGKAARIKSGAFAGMGGVVVRRKGGCRVVLTLEQIMQSVAIEVNEEDLEPMAPVDVMAAACSRLRCL